MVPTLILKTDNDIDVNANLDIGNINFITTNTPEVLVTPTK